MTELDPTDLRRLAFLGAVRELEALQTRITVLRSAFPALRTINARRPRRAGGIQTTTTVNLRRSRAAKAMWLRRKAAARAKAK